MPTLPSKNGKTVVSENEQNEIKAPQESISGSTISESTADKFSELVKQGASAPNSDSEPKSEDHTSEFDKDNATTSKSTGTRKKQKQVQMEGIMSNTMKKYSADTANLTEAEKELRHQLFKSAYICGYISKQNERVDFYKYVTPNQPSDKKTNIEVEIGVKMFAPSKPDRVIVKYDTNAYDAAIRGRATSDVVKNALAANGVAELGTTVAVLKCTRSNPELATFISHTLYSEFINEAPEIWEPYTKLKRSTKTVDGKKHTETSGVVFANYEDSTKFSETGGKPGISVKAKAAPDKTTRKQNTEITRSNDELIDAEVKRLQADPVLRESVETLLKKRKAEKNNGNESYTEDELKNAFRAEARKKLELKEFVTLNDSNSEIVVVYKHSCRPRWITPNNVIYDNVFKTVSDPLTAFENSHKYAQSYLRRFFEKNDVSTLKKVNVTVNGIKQAPKTFIPAPASSLSQMKLDSEDTFDAPFLLKKEYWDTITVEHWYDVEKTVTNENGVATEHFAPKKVAPKLVYRELDENNVSRGGLIKKTAITQSGERKWVDSVPQKILEALGVKPENFNNPEAWPLSYEKHYLPSCKAESVGTKSSSTAAYSSLLGVDVSALVRDRNNK